jgi:hypothetical protein
MWTYELIGRLLHVPPVIGCWKNPPKMQMSIGGSLNRLKGHAWLLWFFERAIVPEQQENQEPIQIGLPENRGPFVLVLYHLKGQCHKIFCVRLFS